MQLLLAILKFRVVLDFVYNSPDCKYYACKYFVETLLWTDQESLAYNEDNLYSIVELYNWLTDNKISTYILK